MTGKLEGFLAPCERARPTNSLSWPRPLFLNHETHEIHERKENGLLLFGYFECVVCSFISQPPHQEWSLGAVQPRTPRYKEGGRAGRCSGESEHSG